jgi:hypothetical protein
MQTMTANSERKMGYFHLIGKLHKACQKAVEYQIKIASEAILI